MIHTSRLFNASRAIGALVVVLASATTASGTTLPGLINEWTMDETSGTVAHDSVGGNDAVLQGFPTNQPTWVPGKIAGSLNFFNASNYVITNLPISQNQYTIDFWLKVNGPGGINPRLVGPRDGHESWVIINDEYHRGVGFYYNGGSNLIQDPNPPSPGVWENYAVTVDLTFSNAAVFRNGIQVASGTFTDHVPLADWVFGHNQDPFNTNDTLNGQLDEIQIYGRILSATEIGQLVPEPSSVALCASAFFATAIWGCARRMREIQGSCCPRRSVASDRWRFEVSPIHQ